MYSDDEKKALYNYQNYDDEGYSYSEKKDTTDIIIKIVLIVLCVLALIWLFKLLKGSNNNSNTIVYNDSLHDSNITTVRLAAERYFFINDNLPKGSNVKTISLQTLINEKLANSIVDGNNKVCDNTKSVISMNKDNSTYLMRINLSCSTKEREEKFYYDYVTHNCINCNGKTYMVDGKVDENVEEVESYSCLEWSDWKDNKVYDETLTERTRILVKGIKKGTEKVNITYGEWSDYTTTPIKKTDDIEVQVKKVATGSGPKVVTKVVKTPDRVVTGCPSGYTQQGNKCYGSVQKGNLSHKEFGNYDVTNRASVEVTTEKNSQGKYEVVYKNCTYRPVTDVVKTVVPGTTKTYTEKVGTTSYITYYRSRTVTKEVTSEGDIITDDYYEEDKLPEGYVKYPGSEKTQYSYKLTTCVK